MIIDRIFDWIDRLMPMFRVAWVSSISIGVVLVLVALLLQRNPSRKTSPWVLGTIGAVMVMSSGWQLVASLI